MTYQIDYGRHSNYELGSLASKRLSEFFDLKKYSQFVETGTFIGDGVAWALSKGFEKIYSVELDAIIHREAKKRFTGNEKVEIVRGNTTDFLANLVTKLEGPTVFYLDAHWSGVHSGRATASEWPMPLLAESKILSTYKDITKSLIVIDDERLMVDTYNPPHSWGAALKDQLLSFWTQLGFTNAYLDDSIIFYMP
jgi:hypothetical protein